jgi:predicted ATPase
LVYLTTGAVQRAIGKLRENTHPFSGITFLACKAFDLPIGTTESVSLDSLTRKHLDQFHVLDRKSNYYFQPFRSAKRWVDKKYPSSGLQTTNTQTFSDVFIHPRKSAIWGFQQDYIDLMKLKLGDLGYADRMPVNALAIWLYKGESFEANATQRDMTDRLFDDFKITTAEQQALFTFENDIGTTEEVFSVDPLSYSDLLTAFEAPPDADEDIGRTIASLKLVNTGPAELMQMDFGERLSIVTGDNGLGKSFLLDFAWWAATGLWAGAEPVPTLAQRLSTSTVTYELQRESGRRTQTSSLFDWRSYSWVRKQPRTVDALAIFSKADGSFAVSDPIKNRYRFSSERHASHLLASEALKGKDGVIEGMVRDWAKWQQAKDQSTFDRFAAVLKRLSPEDLGVLSPGPIVRLPNESRDVPTVRHRYGEVPITQTSSGVQRVLLLAYLIIWAWEEHQIVADQTENSPVRRMVVLVDELEAHLHPKWQRTVLPALMSVGDLLSGDMALQTIAATHSPMILASTEAVFDASSDVLYHLAASTAGVSLEYVDYVKYGDASGWLTSPLFGLRHARSQDAERAIEAAKALQLSDVPRAADVQEVSRLLTLHLSSDDQFWPRWLYFAEQHGVKL